MFVLAVNSSSSHEPPTSKQPPAEPTPMTVTLGASEASAAETVPCACHVSAFVSTVRAPPRRTRFGGVERSSGGLLTKAETPCMLAAFFLSTRRRGCHLRVAEAGAPALAPSEPITTVSDGRAPSADGRSHQETGSASAASAHHPQMAEVGAPALAPSEPIAAVSDGRALSADGRSHQGSDSAPVADPRRGARSGDDSTSHFSATAPSAADDWVLATTSPPAAGHISSFLLHIRRRAADMAVAAAFGAATLADAADDTPQGRKRNNASVSGPSDDDDAGGTVAVSPWPLMSRLTSLLSPPMTPLMARW